MRTIIRFWVILRNCLEKEDLVAIAWWTHLYPYRTQKLSIITAKIVLRCDNSKLPVLFLFTGYLSGILFLSFFYEWGMIVKTHCSKNEQSRRLIWAVSAALDQREKEDASKINGLKMPTTYFSIMSKDWMQMNGDLSEHDICSIRYRQWRKECKKEKETRKKYSKKMSIKRGKNGKSQNSVKFPLYKIKKIW